MMLARILHSVLLVVLLVLLSPSVQAHDELSSCGAFTFNCPEGCYQDYKYSNGTVECVDVGRGFYSARNNNDRYECPPGTYSNITNAGHCRPLCPTGTFTTGLDATECEPCPESDVWENSWCSPGGPVYGRRWPAFLLGAAFVAIGLFLYCAGRNGDGDEEDDNENDVVLDDDQRNALEIAVRNGVFRATLEAVEPDEESGLRDQVHKQPLAYGSWRGIRLGNVLASNVDNSDDWIDNTDDKEKKWYHRTPKECYVTKLCDADELPETIEFTPAVNRGTLQNPIHPANVGGNDNEAPPGDLAQ